MENEILAAELYLSPVNTENATAEIDAELSKVEQALKSYTCTASMFDYATAVISGILAGAVDAFVVSETQLFEKDQKPVKEQLAEAFRKVLFSNNTNDKDARPVMHHAASSGIPAMVPGFENMAVKPTPLGMLAAVVVQLGRGGMLKEKDKKLQFLPDGISKGDGIILACVAAVVGILKWLSAVSSDNTEHSGYQFKTLKKLCDLIRSAPAFTSVVNEIEKWQKQLPNEMKCDSKGKDSDMGAEKVFGSFFLMLGSAPAFKNTNLQKAVQLVQRGKQLGIHEIPIVKCLTRQAFPVLVNEVIVRTVFFASRLAKELKTAEDVSGIYWENVLPFGNRDIDRMLALSTMTLSVADTADAAVHAAIDSGGDTILFATRFVTRFNYVAAGRAAIAVFREISNEKTEQELIHTKRLLTEAKTARALEILLDYQQQLEKRVSEYLAEDITAFLEGFNYMDLGMAEKDSDLVIRGNVIIQRVLGREPQFTNQQEFNELMDSDEPLRL